MCALMGFAPHWSSLVSRFATADIAALILEAWEVGGFSPHLFRDHRGGNQTCRQVICEQATGTVRLPVTCSVDIH